MALMSLDDAASAPSRTPQKRAGQWLPLAILLLIGTVACQPISRLPLSTPDATATMTSEEPVMPITPMPAGAAALANSRPVLQAIDALADTLSLTAAEIELLDARAVVWPDGSLGCPQPDMMYPQVQVEGIVIRLRAGGKEYQYHGGGRREPFLCESPISLDNLPAGGGSN
jgi:hypothetical protein